MSVVWAVHKGSNIWIFDTHPVEIVSVVLCKHTSVYSHLVDNHLLKTPLTKDFVLAGGRETFIIKLSLLFRF